MNGVSPISTWMNRTPAAGGPNPVSPSAFGAALQKANGAQAQKLREVTAQFVSTAFLMPMLRQVREDPFKSELFHGGQGEKVFGAQLDQTLADRITQSPAFPLVDRLYEHLADR